MEHVDPQTDPLYYRDTSDWSPGQWYSLWRLFNRLLADTDGSRAAGTMTEAGQQPSNPQVAAIDLGRVDARAAWLLKTMLVAMGRYDRYLLAYPNLRGLAEVFRPAEPIVLSTRVRHHYPAYTAAGVLL